MEKRGKIKRSFLILLCLAAFSLAAALPVGAAITYEGEILAGDGGGLSATGGWDSKSSILSWIVHNDHEVGFWTYQYTFTVPSGSKHISHVIVEVSDGFTSDNIKGWSPTRPILGSYSEDQGDGNTNPGMPDSLKGLKWDISGNVYFYTFSITSDRVPMWGDFYAKDGKLGGGPGGGDDVYAYNTGFGDKNYQHEPLQQGALVIDGKAWVMVPNTHVVPIPGSLLLLGSGLIGLVGWRKWRGCSAR